MSASDDDEYCSETDCYCKEFPDKLYEYFPVINEFGGKSTRCSAMIDHNNPPKCSLCTRYMLEHHFFFSKDFVICCHCLDLLTFIDCLLEFFDSFCDFVRVFQDLLPKCDLKNDHTLCTSCNKEHVPRPGTQKEISHLDTELSYFNYIEYLSKVLEAATFPTYEPNEMFIKLSAFLIAKYKAAYETKKARNKEKHTRLVDTRKHLLRASIPFLKNLTDNDLNVYIPSKRARITKTTPITESILTQLETDPSVLSNTTLVSILKLLFQ